MLLQELAKNPLVLRSRVERPEFDLLDLQCDSRRVGAGDGFFALAGFRADGHAYLDAARAAGAGALFVTEPAAFERLERELAAAADAADAPGAGGAGAAGIFLVEGGRAGLAGLASLLWRAPSRRMALLGVTGTNGKTTVAHLVAQLMGALGRPCGVIGSLGLFLPEAGAGAGAGAGADPAHTASERTTPEAPDIERFLARCLAGGVGMAAMEATSIGIALQRTRELAFRAAAFTNLSQDHLDFHRTREAYREAKFSLFLREGTAAAVVNRDDPAGAELLQLLKRERPALPLLPFSLGGEGGLALELGKSDGEGGEGTLLFEGRRYPFRTRLVGAFNLSNLLAALGLLLAIGEQPAALAGAAEACRGVAGRFERVAPALPFAVLVDYAHTPDALENALRAARTLGPARVLVLFGCGGQRDRAKRPQMGRLAEQLAEVAVLTSDNPRGEEPEAIIAQIAAGLSGGGAEVEQIVERREAIHWLLARARPGDLVLLAGKGHEETQEIAGEKFPFDDRQVVRQWAREKGYGETG